MKPFFLIFVFSISLSLFGQTNASLSNNNALQVLTGNYQPANYAATNPVSASDQIACEINNLVSADTLHQYLQILTSFATRHTWSDTVSQNFGIGAARRWAFSKMQQFSRENENRLIPSYLTFDIPNNTCGSLNGTKNVLGVLPGSDVTDPSVVLIMGHLDSRCAARCDSNCPAAGADDNGSGSVLVLELARIMSRYTFDHTIVFMLTTGEEQGLIGARAMSDYCVAQGIDVKSVLNNDIVGGVICGQTASPPGCSNPDTYDSTTVRLYANPLSSRNPHQGFARTIKLLYQEKMRSNVKVPMEVDIINQEDRGGRGGDHIAFRENGFRNARFTSAHEHGNGNPLGTPNYVDHQHTSDDVIGVDTDNDNLIDSFFVDFNYLGRNAVINGTSAAFFASGPDVPEFTLHDEPNGLRVEITDGKGASEFRLGIKQTAGADYDSLYRFSGTSFTIPSQQSGSIYFVGVAGINAQGVMSAFTQDERAISQSNTAAGTTDNLPYGIDCSAIGMAERAFLRAQSGLQLLPPRPNPLQHTADLVVLVKDEKWVSKQLTLVVLNTQGQRIAECALELNRGANSFQYQHRASSGLYHYYLSYNNARVSQTQRMLVR